MAYAYAQGGSDGKFYVSPLYARCNGIAFDNIGDAETVANAINEAFEAGQEHIKECLRNVIGAAPASED